MSEQEVPAGWYEDPEMAGTQRYWDGEEWTDHVAPLDVRTEAEPVTEDREVNSGAENAGWIFAIFLPILGLLIGLFLIGKSKSAGAIIGTSVVFAVIWLAVAGAFG